MVDGTSVYQATLPTGMGWLPAISIGSDDPGDVSACINFGQNRFDTLIDGGWSEQSTGLPDITLSLCTDAMLLRGGSAGSVPYAPRLLNGRSASIRLAGPPYDLDLNGLACRGDESRLCCPFSANGEEVIATGRLNYDRGRLWLDSPELCRVE
jgi:hypothetical protein